MILGARGSCKKHRVIEIPLFQTSMSSLLQDGDLGNDKEHTCVLFFNCCKLSYFNGFHDNLRPERGCLWRYLNHTILCHWLQPQMCVSRSAQQDLFKQAAMFKFTCLLEILLPILNTLKRKQHSFEAYTSLLFLNLKYTLRLQWQLLCQSIRCPS